MLRSIKIMYKGGVLSKRQYQCLSVITNPKCVPYKSLVKYIDNINVVPVTPLTGVAGRKRDLEQLLLYLAKMYMKIESSVAETVVD